MEVKDARFKIEIHNSETQLRKNFLRDILLLYFDKLLLFKKKIVTSILYNYF